MIYIIIIVIAVIAIGVYGASRTKSEPSKLHPWHNPQENLIIKQTDKGRYVVNPQTIAPLEFNYYSNEDFEKMIKWTLEGGRKKNDEIELFINNPYNCLILDKFISEKNITKSDFDTDKVKDEFLPSAGPLYYERHSIFKKYGNDKKLDMHIRNYARDYISQTHLLLTENPNKFIKTFNFYDKRPDLEKPKTYTKHPIIEYFFKEYILRQ